MTRKPLLLLALSAAAPGVAPAAQVPIPALDKAQAEARSEIAAQSARFSQAYVDGDIDALIAIYSEDGVAAPGGRDFIRGRDALRLYWQPAEGVDVTEHRAVPVEIVVAGDHAYDWGHYSGATVAKGETRPFAGKYLIVWRREKDGAWRMVHDMWNTLPRD